MATQPPALVLYRTLLRQARKLEKTATTFTIREPLIGSWGSYRYATGQGSDYQSQVLRTLLPKLSFSPSISIYDGETVARIVRDNFRQHQHASTIQQAELLDEALRGLRVLFEQQYLQKCSSLCETEGVEVQATSCFSQTNNRYDGTAEFLFTYRIRIANNRKENIQVLGRSWVIQNDNGDIVVHIPLNSSNAVVGQQPVIAPGDWFEYYSGSSLPTAHGLMSGCLAVAVLTEGRPKGVPPPQVVVRVASLPLLKPSKD